MNGTRDSDDTTTAGEGGLDPSEAATLLQQATRQARRQFEATPPWLSAIRAIVVLAAYGAIWLSVRDQHPYKGPTGLVLIGVYLLVVIVLRATAIASKRASAGVSRRSQRLPSAEITAVIVAIVAVYVFMGALYHAGASLAIVYGIYPATALLIAGGGMMARVAAVREDWPVFGSSVATVTIGALSAFAGPVTVWAIAGAGMFLVLVGHAFATARLERA